MRCIGDEYDFIDTEDGAVAASDAFSARREYLKASACLELCGILRWFIHRCVGKELLIRDYRLETIV